MSEKRKEGDVCGQRSEGNNDFQAAAEQTYKHTLMVGGGVRVAKLKY